MPSEQAFEESVDTEHLFVLQWKGSEQMFEKGAAVSVALELEYEAAYPGLRLVEAPPRPAPPRPVRRHWLGPVLVAAVALGLLALLALPIGSIGGRSIAGSAPTAGQEYVVRSGDTLTSIAQRAGGGNVAGMVQRLSAETGSSTIVPGEHLLIP